MELKEETFAGVFGQAAAEVDEQADEEPETPKATGVGPGARCPSTARPIAPSGNRSISGCFILIVLVIRWPVISRA